MILVLEIARGLASLWVFFYHVKELFLSSSHFIYDVSTYGSLGVPMFFVISGYVITFSAESSLKQNKSALIFLKNRFMRIYPTFWISVIIVIFLPYLIEYISSIKSGIYITPENIFYKLNYPEWLGFLTLTKVFLASSHNLQTEFNSVNSVYWTLAIEFQFYLVVFIALCSGKYFRHVIAGVTVVALAIIPFNIVINYGLFIHYWPSFSVGIVLAYLHKSGHWFKPEGNLKSIFFVFCFIATCYLLTIEIIQNPTSNNNLVFSIGFGFMLWFFAYLEKYLLSLKNSNNLLVPWLLEPWLLLGSMSYSVYLLHGKLYQLPNMFVRQIFGVDSISYGTLTILLTLLICYPFYLVVERRFLSKNYQKLHKEVLENSSHV